MIEGLTVLFGALLGAALGSFWACAAYRVPRGLSLTKERSYCPGCQAPIPWYRNLPIISWLALRGKSACCQQPISPSYLLIEALGALLGALSAFWAGIWSLFLLALGTLLVGWWLDRR